MGLRQTISEWVVIIKDAFDFGPEFPAAMEARRAMYAQDSAQLQQLLEQTRRACREKDELIAKLRTAGAVIGNMVVDGAAYYIRKANTLEGPFCTACFQRNHEVVRIASAPKPKDAEGIAADWVQCAKCKTPFRSERISQYLNPARVPAGRPSPVGVPPKRDEPPSGSLTDQGPGRDDRRQVTEDRGSKAEPPSHPSAVLYQPPSDQQREPKPPQAQNPALGGSAATQKDELGTSRPNGTSRVEAPKPALAPLAAPAQESDTPKGAKAGRKRRKEFKRDTPDLGKTPTREGGPVEEAPASQGIALANPSPTSNAALETPRPGRPRARTCRPKDQRSEKTMVTDRSKPTR